MVDVEAVTCNTEPRRAAAPHPALPPSLAPSLPLGSPWMPALPGSGVPRPSLALPALWWGTGAGCDVDRDVREPVPGPPPPGPYPPVLLLPEHTLAARRKRREQRPRRQRTTFSGEQTLALELEFRRAEYVTRSRRVELADRLALSESQVKIWFQNRRAKDKRIEKARLDQQIRSMGFGGLPPYVPGFSLATPLSATPPWTGWLRPQSAGHAPITAYSDD